MSTSNKDDNNADLSQAIYDMLGAGAVKPTDTAEERAKDIFVRCQYGLGASCYISSACPLFPPPLSPLCPPSCSPLLLHLRMDENNDSTLTEEEFLKGCLQDDELSKMLAPNAGS